MYITGGKSKILSTGKKFQSRLVMSEFSEDKEKDTIEITTNKEQEVVKPLTPAKLAKFKKAQDNTGIIYLSSIPPFMKPSKIKHLLEQFGNIGRVYLAPEGKLF
jgi:ESF2/ABP1 family protein